MRLGDSVTVHMDAPRQAVWELVSDVTRIGEFSPETFEGEWLDGATGPVVGARFRGHVKRNGRGPVYWSPAFVTACAPGEEFAFSVGKPDKKPMIAWGYRLVDAPEGGTDVTEYFELAPRLPMKIYWALMGWSRGRTNREGMRTTLERIRTVVESTG